MGLLINGTWHDQWYDTKSTGGRFVRKESAFRDWVTADGSSGFKAEADRYHLYVSLACPWAHRTLIFRRLKKLQHIISVSIVDPLMGSEGWAFSSGTGCTADSVNLSDHLHQVYTRADADYTGRVTVPVLWDKQTSTIVSNESAEIIRMLNTAFNAFGDAGLDYYPEPLREAIDEVNAWVYHGINNGVYRCGFATTQEAYEEAYYELFEALDRVEGILQQQPFLVGDTPTEADWRLFTTLIRFDAVYVGHFKCNRQRIADYPAMSTYVEKLYRVPGVADTVNMTHIKRHYYESHRQINPTGVVPVGPDLPFLEPA